MRASVISLFVLVFVAIGLGIAGIVLASKAKDGNAGGPGRDGLNGRDGIDGRDPVPANFVFAAYMNGGNFATPLVGNAPPSDLYGPRELAGGLEIATSRGTWTVRRKTISDRDIYQLFYLSNRTITVQVTGTISLAINNNSTVTASLFHIRNDVETLIPTSLALLYIGAFSGTLIPTAVMSLQYGDGLIIKIQSSVSTNAYSQYYKLQCIEI